MDTVKLVWARTSPAGSGMAFAHRQPMVTTCSCVCVPQVEFVWAREGSMGLPVQACSNEDVLP